jgi:hypothetical protein
MTTTESTEKANVIADVEQVFTAMEKFIKQRPGLDFRDYWSGDHWNARTDAVRNYRGELRSINKDRHRALAALDTARGLMPAKPELLADAFKRAFSGRLSWCPKQHHDHLTGSYTGALNYCTGQYWPTEYRKAAASVLECYIASWKQAVNAQSPRMFTYTDMASVRAANQSIGNHWFDRDSMRFFNTRLESGLIAGRYFITSERMDENHARRYSVREALPDGSIDTIGEFQAYTTKEDAREAIKAL